MIVGLFKYISFTLLAVLSFIIFFVDVEPETSMFIEKWIDERWDTLMSVGTLLLVAVLTVFATELANDAAAKREKNNRLISAELKKSEFRQEWINALRDDLARIVGLSKHYNIRSARDKTEKNKVVEELKNLDARVRLRLNPHKEKENQLKSLVFKTIDAVEIGSQNIATTRDELADFGAIFIKEEWENLKTLLDAAK